MLLGLQVADNTGAALIFGDRVSDSFDALTYVDVAGATNLDTGTVGLLKPTSAGSAIAAGTGTASTDAGIRTTAWTDGTSSQDSNSCTVKTSATSMYLRKNYSPAKAIHSVVVFGSSDQGFVESANPTVTLNLYGKNGGSPSTPTDGTLIGTLSFTDTANESTGRTVVSTAPTTTYDYVWVNIVQSGGAGIIDCAECTFYETSGANNLTVRSASFTAASAPSAMKAVIRVKEVDAAAPGTDYTLEFSRDGGTTWTVATLTELFTSPSPTASIRVCQTNEVNVSGQPSGTSPRWRFNTLNNKNIELHDAGLSWS